MQGAFIFVGLTTARANAKVQSKRTRNLKCLTIKTLLLLPFLALVNNLFSIFWNQAIFTSEMVFKSLLEIALCILYAAYR